MFRAAPGYLCFCYARKQYTLNLSPLAPYTLLQLGSI